MPNPLASPLWRNRAFVRLWTASTISVFGSFLTRFALPLLVILTLGAGPLEVALLRGVELGSAVVVGLVAGAWVDRLRRRPVLIWADLGRAALLGSIPLAFVLDVLTFWQVLAVTASTAILTTFFDAADNAFLPTLVERERLVEANGALAASGSASEFLGFGLSGILVQVLTAPLTILIDALTYVVSAVLLLTIRHEEVAPPTAAEREPVLDEIRHGLRLVRHDPILRAFASAAMVLAGLWGILGAIYILFAIEVLGLSPALVGVAAAMGGVASLAGAALAGRVDRSLRHRPGSGRRLAHRRPGQRVHPARAGGRAAHRAGVPARPATRGRLRPDHPRHHRDVRPPGARPGSRAGPGRGHVLGPGGRGPALDDHPGRHRWPSSSGCALVAFVAPLGGIIAAAILWWSPVRQLVTLPVLERPLAAPGGRRRRARPAGGRLTVRRRAPRRRRPGRRPAGR